MAEFLIGRIKGDKGDAFTFDDLTPEQKEELKGKNGHTTVREYIPCMRKSDGELGVFEPYTETFITRSGSGSFAYGAIIGW